MVALKSSSVRAAGYDEIFKTLYVEFTSGITYKYDYVPKEVFRDFINSKSPGKYVNAVLTQMFPYKPVPGAEHGKRGKSPFELSEDEIRDKEKAIDTIRRQLMDYQAKIYEEFDDPQEAEDHCTQVLMKMFGSSERVSRRQVRNLNEMLKWEKEE